MTTHKETTMRDVWPEISEAEMQSIEAETQEECQFWENMRMTEHEAECRAEGYRIFHRRTNFHD